MAMVAAAELDGARASLEVRARTLDAWLTKHGFVRAVFRSKIVHAEFGWKCKRPTALRCAHERCRNLQRRILTIRTSWHIFKSWYIPGTS
eukprot:5427731-Pleurochrysis_carterae.AAC.3